MAQFLLEPATERCPGRDTRVGCLLQKLKQNQTSCWNDKYFPFKSSEIFISLVLKQVTKHPFANIQEYVTKDVDNVMGGWTFERQSHPDRKLLQQGS